MDAVASQITSLEIVYSTVYSDVHQRKHQSSASLAFVRGIHRGPVNSPHKWPVTRKMFPFDDVIMNLDQFRTMMSGHTFPKLWYLIMDSYSALHVGVDSGHCYVQIHDGKQNKD